MILRGGTRTGPNYEADHVSEVCAQLAAKGLRETVMIDCSHGNSQKDHRRQARRRRLDLPSRCASGSWQVFGAMLESHLVEGRQDYVPGQPAVYGQSITDACLSLEQTEPLLEQFADGAAGAGRRPSHVALAFRPAQGRPEGRLYMSVLGDGKTHTGETPMTRILSLVIVSAALLGASGGADARVDMTDTRLLSQPAVERPAHRLRLRRRPVESPTATARDVRRLTSDDGHRVERRPSRPTARRSPSAREYDGNTDVYIVPSQAACRRGSPGIPAPTSSRASRRTASSVLFTSPRAVFTTRYTQLFTVPVGRRDRGSAADPERVARQLLARRQAASPTTRSVRRACSGSTTAAARTSRIWIYDAEDHAVEQIPQPKDRCNDVDPQWVGDTRLLPLRPRRRVQPVRLRRRRRSRSSS